ncbi:MAG: BRO family protein, partial [Holosporales bacterium]
MTTPHKIIVFENANIRRTLHNGEWWFSVVDVVGALTQSVDAGAYWRKLKQRLGAEGSEVVTFCHGLKLVAPDGKMRETDCANTETIFRLIQSIPSPKAEPFKRWLAKVGYERVQEIEDPELATQRTRALYKAKGYSDAWIEKRMRGIPDQPRLFGHPIVGMSWEGFVLENLLSVTPPQAQTGFYRTARGAEVDLVLNLGGRGGIWAIEIKHGLTPKPKRGFYQALEDIQPDKA